MWPCILKLALSTNEITINEGHTDLCLVQELDRNADCGSHGCGFVSIELSRVDEAEAELELGIS